MAKVLKAIKQTNHFQLEDFNLFFSTQLTNQDMRNLIIIFSFICFSNVSFSQIDKEKAIGWKQEQKLADYLYAQGKFYSAIEYYKEVVREKPENRYAKYWLAMSYLKANDYANAKQWFQNFAKQKPGPKESTKRFEKENEQLYNFFNYYYGVALKHNENYDDAIKMFKSFKASYKPETDKKKKNEVEDNWIAKTNNEIKGAELGQENLPSKKIKVKPLSQAVNSAYTEAGPVVVSDSVIYYTSLNEDKLIFVEKKKDIPPYRLFQSTKVNGEWQKGQALPDFINSEEFGTGTAAISEDGNRMYFSRCYNSEIDEVICNLFFSEKNPKGKWQEPIKLNNQINNPKYTSTHPAVRTSGDKMDIIYFVSDREGGVGGMDIWYFIRTARGDYKGPRLVKGINTKQDELSPFYDNDKQRLFFSSNGYPSLGGFDVFISEEDEELGWKEPQNVGKPINSPADDLFYTIQAKDGSSGFLVSNREGTTLLNKRYPGDDIFYFEDWKYGLEGFVFKSDKDGEGPLEGATVTLYHVDDAGNEVVLKTLENVSEEYFFNLKPENDYKVEVSKAGFAPKYEFVSTKDIPYEDTLIQNLSVDRTSLAVVVNLYDDTDTLKKEKLFDAIVSINENLPNGNTRTISSKRITEQNKNFSFDIEAKRNYTLSVIKDGYFKAKVDVVSEDFAKYGDDINQDIFMSKIQVGKSYELANVLYDFGKSTLRKESKEVLNDLLEILQENPTIVVELSAHTDNIGSSEANLKLSQARAQSCVDYLASNGIPKSRLVAKGYGMSKPIAENTKEDGSDNPDGRQKNRRTEFKVIGGY